MLRRFFKPMSRQRHRWKGHWVLRPFQLVLEQPMYWSLNRRSVTRAFAIGLLISFVPVPAQAPLAILAALVLRLNVPAAILGTFLVNPFTMVPLYMAAYWVGCALLDVPSRHVAFEMSWEWLSTTLLPIWKPFLLGCLVLGSATAVLGYILLGGLWHLSLVLKYHERKGGRTQIKSD
jgi:uncharacterized protein (DUF2062 family)